jgi:hypothetical protein
MNADALDALTTLNATEPASLVIQPVLELTCWLLYPCQHFLGDGVGKNLNAIATANNTLAHI